MGNVEEQQSSIKWCGIVLLLSIICHQIQEIQEIPGMTMIPMKMTKVPIEGDTILLEADIQEKEVPEGDGLKEKVLLEEALLKTWMMMIWTKMTRMTKIGLTFLLIPRTLYLGKEPICNYLRGFTPRNIRYRDYIQDRYA